MGTIPGNTPAKFEVHTVSRFGTDGQTDRREEAYLASGQCCIKYILKVFQLQNTNYIFKMYFKYFSQLLLKTSTKYKIQNTFSKSN